MGEARKRAASDSDAPSDAEIEEQLCAHAAEALNHFTRQYHIRASTEVARNRLKSALYLEQQRRLRLEYRIPANTISHEAIQGLQIVQTSELLEPPDLGVKDVVKIAIIGLRDAVSLAKRSVVLPKVPSIPTATMWTALTKNFEVEDEPQLKFLPYFGDDDEEDVVSEFYQIKQQRTSACEVEFTKEMCEAVLKTLQSTWDLTPSDLKRVAGVIEVEEEVLVEVHKNLRQAQRAAKKKRRLEAQAAANGEAAGSTSVQDGLLDDDQTNLSVEEYFEQYEEAADSYRTLFCRRCFVYDCDYHGCVEKPKLSIAEQNAVELLSKEKEEMLNTGRNCGNDCFLAQSSSRINGYSKARAINATFGWDKQARTLCARAYFICSGNFCEMAKLLGDKTCGEVAEMCAHYNINDHSLVKKQSNNRRSRKKKNSRMSIAHLQNAQNGVVNSVQIKIEACAHAGPCEPGVCSCMEDGIFCSKHCHCVHEDCKIFFQGCQCQRGRCRTKACPCYCAGRECDLDLCKVCCAEEINARERGAACGEKNRKRQVNGVIKDDKHKTSCQNRSIALGKQKHVRMGRSNLPAAGWGLFVDEFVSKDEFIIEYIGEMVSQEEADRRGSVYDKVDRSYLFNLDTKTVIDSTRKGNKTRFINHSKNPNCACKIMNVGSDFRIGLYALRDIEPHTELFFDYGYDKELYHAELLKQPTVTEWMKK